MSPERNKQMLLDLYRAVVDARWDTVRELLSEDFVDHNPGMRAEPGMNGCEAFIAYFRDGETPLHGAQVEIQRMIADAEYAVVHYKLVNARRPGGVAVVDVFRVIDGRFCEHWDVLQDVPTSAANPRAMF
ncbi:Putative membrane protein [Minicystis rosea]|nr:Putative membrane protein [Minicystis rosea]